MEIIKEGHPVLREVATEVTEFDESLVVFCNTMVETMLGAKGCGLAAPQVGCSERILVISDNDTNVTVMVNPVMVDHSTDLLEIPEGCLSLPGVQCTIKRPSRCVVRFQTPTGEEKERTLDLWESRVFQHELDHLNGILMTERRHLQDDC